MLSDVSRHAPLLRRLQWAGFTAGTAGGLLWAHAGHGYSGTAYQLVAVAVDMLTAPLLAAAYAATVLRILARPGADARRRPSPRPAGWP